MIASVFLTCSVSAQENKASVALTTAIYEEEVTGNLDKAVELYLDILKKYPDDRPVAAKALYHLGLVNEKMGKQKATEYFTRLVNTYPDQIELVALAKERLSSLLASVDVPHKPSFRKITIPTELSWIVKLSPDGKNLLMGSDEKLWALPLEGNLGPGFSGTPVQINTDGTEVWYNGLFWSYDGKWIAFNEYSDADSCIEWICIVPYRGGKPKKVFRPFRGPRTVNYQISISPGGKKLAFSMVKDGEQYIYSIPVEGGNPIKLTDMEAREPVFSPDGKMIAFAADRGIGRGEGDLGLWVVPSGGGTPHLVADAIKATSPVWSPDGNMIAYIDEEQPRMSIARIDKTGHAIGNPVSIDAPEGTSFISGLAGWTPDNKIGILLVTEQESAIYTLPVQGGQAAMIQHTPGAFIKQPRWSPDGKQVYYSAPREEVNFEGVPHSWTIIASVPASGGNGKTVPCDLNDKNIRLFPFGGGHRVSPDGKTMIAGAWTPEDASSEYYFTMARIWKLALDGTGSTQITKTKGPFMDTDPCWSSDGKKIAFIRHKLNKGKKNPIPIADQDIYMVNSADGEPELLDSVPGKSIQSLVWSPDGKMLACLVTQE